MLNIAGINPASVSAAAFQNDMKNVMVRLTTIPPDPVCSDTTATTRENTPSTHAKLGTLLSEVAGVAAEGVVASTKATPTLISMSISWALFDPDKCCVTDELLQNAATAHRINDGKRPRCEPRYVDLREYVAV